MKWVRCLIYPSAALLIGVAWHVVVLGFMFPRASLDVGEPGYGRWLASFMITSASMGIVFKRWIVRARGLWVIVVSILLTVMGSIVFVECWMVMESLTPDHWHDSTRPFIDRLLAPILAGVTGAVLTAPVAVPMGIASVLFLKGVHGLSAAVGRAPVIREP